MRIGSIYPMPIVAAHTLDVVSHSPEQTQRFGAQLATLLEPGDVIGLLGELGSGKTVFVQGLARGLGVRESVHSPTFVLANEYRSGSLPLYHIDAYRVRNAGEALGIGLEDYMNGSGVTVIEWVDRILTALPAEHLVIEFRHVSESERGILVRSQGNRYQLLVDELKQRTSRL